MPKPGNEVRGELEGVSVATDPLDLASQDSSVIANAQARRRLDG